MAFKIIKESEVTEQGRQYHNGNTYIWIDAKNKLINFSMQKKNGIKFPIKMTDNKVDFLKTVGYTEKSGIKVIIDEDERIAGYLFMSVEFLSVYMIPEEFGELSNIYKISGLMTEVELDRAILTEIGWCNIDALFELNKVYFINWSNDDYFLLKHCAYLGKIWIWDYLNPIEYAPVKNELQGIINSVGIKRVL